MARKLRLITGKRGPRSALVYGMRLVEADEVGDIEDARIQTAAGKSTRVTMHVIEGTHAQIRKQLMQSIDAFFELFEDQ